MLTTFTISTNSLGITCPWLETKLGVIDKVYLLHCTNKVQRGQNSQRRLSAVAKVAVCNIWSWNPLGLLLNQDSQLTRSPTYLGGALSWTSWHYRGNSAHEQTSDMKEVNKAQTEFVPKYCVMLLCCTALVTTPSCCCTVYHSFLLATLTFRSPWKSCRSLSESRRCLALWETETSDCPMRSQYLLQLYSQ